MGRDVLALDRYNTNCGCMGYTGVIEGETEGEKHQWVPVMAHGVWEDRELLTSQER